MTSSPQQRAATALACMLMGLAVAHADSVVVSNLHTFHSPGDSEGYGPGTVVVGAGGTLYGVTQWGGAGGQGTFFRIKRDGPLETLSPFNGPEGSQADVCLLPGADGNFYATTDTHDIPVLGTGGGFEYRKVEYWRIVFRITPAGSMTAVAELRAPKSRDDYHSVLVKGVDQQTYGIDNYAPSPTFELVRMRQQATADPPFQIVNELVRSTGFMPALNARDAAVVAAEAQHSTADVAGRQDAATPPLCGNVVAARDGHFWHPLLQRSGLGRSYSKLISDPFYDPVPGYLPGVQPRTENPDYSAASGALGRFVESSEGLILATSGHYVNGVQQYEVIAVAATGEIFHHIPLDLPGFEPAQGLLLAKDGAVYGLAQGTVRDAKDSYLLYRIRATGGAAEVVYRFPDEGSRRPPGTTPAGHIRSPLVQDPEGNLYATFIEGGADHHGAIFRISLRP